MSSIKCRETPVYRQMICTLTINLLQMEGKPVYNRALMSARVPLSIDPYKAADRNAEFKGELPLSRFNRLNSLSPNTDGVVSVEFSFRRDSILKHCVAGKVTAGLRLTCQRCMEIFEFPVNSDFDLKLVTTEAEAEQLDDGVDPLLVEDDELDIVAMIEDELLLAIPVVPRHEDGTDCASQTWREAEELPGSENPFDVLGSLKKH